VEGHLNRAQTFLVQQGVLDMPVKSTPLDAGYMKASALADAGVREQADIQIHNFRGGATNAKMANAMCSGVLSVPSTSC
jgi:radical SAM C-methyltransferase